MIDFYLHDCPEQAASMLPSALLYTGVVQIAQALSATWSRAGYGKDGSRLIVLDWARIEPSGLPELGDWQMITLCSQRIYDGFSHGGGFEVVNWAVQYGGNYDWLYRYGAALCERYASTSKGKCPHICQQVMRTLELCPPTLWETLGTYSDFKELGC
jgi:hypothetical protein